MNGKRSWSSWGGCMHQTQNAIWAHTNGNLLICDIEESQPIREVRDSILAAFRWAMLEGPLGHEPMRGLVFRITKVVLHSDAIHRGGGQIIPTARKVFYGLFLRSSPSLAEPVYQMEIICSSFAVEAVVSAFKKRGATCEIRKQNDPPRGGTVLVGHGRCIRLLGIYSELRQLYGVIDYQIVDVLWEDVADREWGNSRDQFQETLEELRTRKNLGSLEETRKFGS